MDIRIDRHKEANAAFWKALAALEQRSFSDPWTEEMLKTSLAGENCRLFTAEEEGALLGYLMLLTVAPEGEILNLAVSPDRRREGIGDRLMDALFACCEEEKVETLFLEVRASNLPAARLYLKRGFLPVGKRKNYYRYPTEDALVMMKQILFEPN